MINRRKLESVREGKERDRRKERDRKKSGGKIEQVKCRMVKSNRNKNGSVIS